MTVQEADGSADAAPADEPAADETPADSQAAEEAPADDIVE